MERLADGRGGRSREQRDRENTEKEAKPQAETTVTNGTRPSSLRQRWRARARGTDGPRGMLPRLGERSSAGGAGCRREPNSGWSRRAKKKGSMGETWFPPCLLPHAQSCVLPRISSAADRPASCTSRRRSSSPGELGSAASTAISPASNCSRSSTSARDSASRRRSSSARGSAPAAESLLPPALNPWRPALVARSFR